MMSQFALSAATLSAVTEIIRQMGVVPGRVRIQKMTYFLKRLGMPELEEVDFFYHHYGPFSWTVAESLVEGVQNAVVREVAKPLDDDRQAYTYSLLRDDIDGVDPVSPESVQLVDRLVAVAKAEHWRTLELASTIDFLSQRDNLPFAEAEARALKLKPLCKDYQVPAVALLEKLNLHAV